MDKAVGAQAVHLGLRKARTGVTRPRKSLKVARKKFQWYRQQRRDLVLLGSATGAASESVPAIRHFPPAGNVLSGRGWESLPVVLIVMLAGTDQSYQAMVERIAQEQVMLGCFRPLLAVDSHQTMLPNEYGYGVELFVARDKWEFNEDYEDYLTRRLVEIRQTYCASDVIFAEPDRIRMQIRVSLGVS